jgi:YidC/Oxa1 family membrane protein insertase
MTKVTMKQQGQDNNPAMNSTKSMMYMMPLMTVYFGFVMPAALGVYWIAQSVFSLFQEIILGKFYNEKLQKEEDEREAARAADRKKRIEEGRVQQEKFRNQTEQKLTLKEKQKAAEPVPTATKAPEAPAAAPAPLAKGSCGPVMLHDVPDRTAAMLMAIVADELKTPLNELRFISIKEVK